MDGSSRPEPRVPRPATRCLEGLVDTHCHLDAGEYDGDHAGVLERAAAAGVRAIVVPAVLPSGFAALRGLIDDHPGRGLGYALGIHPLAVPTVGDEALEQLEQALIDWHGDPRLLAVGEIGLDYFVDDPDPARQERFFEAQLRLARRFDLPVIMHGRKAADRLAAALRRVPVCSGIAHAFNGSEQQARALVSLGVMLGFGGVMTFPRSLRIRRAAAGCPAGAFVLETDGPDLAPAWLAPARNEPSELPGIAECMAGLRGVGVEELVAAARRNACRALPRLRGLLTQHPAG